LCFFFFGGWGVFLLVYYLCVEGRGECGGRGGEAKRA